MTAVVDEIPPGRSFVRALLVDEPTGDVEAVRCLPAMDGGHVIVDVPFMNPTYAAGDQVVLRKVGDKFVVSRLRKTAGYSTVSVVFDESRAAQAGATLEALEDSGCTIARRGATAASIAIPPDLFRSAYLKIVSTSRERAWEHGDILIRGALA